MEQAQLMAQQDIANQNAALQQEIADQQMQQNQEALDYQKSQDAQRQAEADQQKAVQAAYDQQRSDLASQMTDWVSQAYTPYNEDYYNQYASDYVAALQPEVDRQYKQAQSQMIYGLARNGQLNSQSHADLQGQLDETRGRAMTDIATQATQSAQQLQASVAQQQQATLQQMLNTGALGQPVAPGTMDEVNAQIPQTTADLGQIQLTSQDQLAKIGQLPTTSSLGTIFGGVSSGATNYLAGLNQYNIATGYGSGPNAPKL